MRLVTEGLLHFCITCKNAKAHLSISLPPVLRVQSCPPHLSVSHCYHIFCRILILSNLCPFCIWALHNHDDVTPRVTSFQEYGHHFGILQMPEISCVWARSIHGTVHARQEQVERVFWQKKHVKSLPAKSSI